MLTGCLARSFRLGERWDDSELPDPTEGRLFNLASGSELSDEG